MADSKLIVLTGATRGLGRALADEFLDLGHTVYGCGRSTDQVEVLQQSTGPRGHFAVVDVRDPEQVESWAKFILDSAGTPDLLINNAAIINQPAPLWEIPREDFSRLVDINIKGVFYCCKAFLPAMVKQQRGVVINLSSGWGRSVSPEMAPYCASKYAIEGLSQAMAEEVPKGMAVVPLNPGVIDTEMLRICFGDSAHAYPTADIWARKAAKYMLAIGPRDNGRSLTVA